MTARAAFVLAAALAVLAPASAEAANRRVAVPEIGSPSPVAVLSTSRGIHLEAKPQPNEGLLAFTERLCGSPRHASAVSRANGGVRRLRRGVSYRIPFDLLPARHQETVVRALLPNDEPTVDGWRHRVAASTRGRRAESLWSIAEWFTRSGENHRALRQANGLSGNVIVPGQTIVVPRRFLVEPFAGMLPDRPPPTVVAAVPEPAPQEATERAPETEPQKGPEQAPEQAPEAAPQRTPERSAEGTPFVRYGSDDEGEYASYRLNAGEALYSSVVMRFTGQLFAAEINQLVNEIAERNAIADVRDIPAGYEVKVPFELLSPLYLPGDHPRRREWEAQRSVADQIENELMALDLAGVTVVLDAGHGGRDTGAPIGGLWESVYVYDIMLRTKKILESRTAARVIPTTREGSTFRIHDSDLLPHTQGHKVLTEPPYRIDNAAVATNFRWYLSNSVYRQQRQAGAEPGKVIFISIHADSLHPSLRGAMVYIPGLVGITNNYGKTGVVYSARREVRAEPRVSFTRTERTTSKGLSQDLAQQMLDSFRRSDLAVHHNRPIRDRIVRGRRAYVPAQLRFNRVPAKILLEVCNMGNEKDRSLLKTRAWRQRVAEAIVNGVLSYYGVPQSSSAVAGGS